MFRVQPEMLRASTQAMNDVTEVSKALDMSRGELADLLTRTGSDPVSRSAQAFLDAWSLGLRNVAERTESIGTKLHMASVEYEEAEHRLRGHLGSSADGIAGGGA